MALLFTNIISKLVIYILISAWLPFFVAFLARLLCILFIFLGTYCFSRLLWLLRLPA